MVAAEREVYDALIKEIGNDHSKKLLFITASDSDENNYFLDAAGTSQNITLVMEWNDLKLKKHHNCYDAAIANKVIVGSKIINDPSELELFILCCLNALKKDGVILIREDLDGYLATEKVTSLTAMLDIFRFSDGSQNIGFDFKCLKQVDASIHKNQNFLDLYWILKKQEFIRKGNENVITFRDFLDKTQYTDTGIFAYEWIFGENFISPGGAAENMKILKRLGELKSGQTMLDIGVGIGGGARQAAAEFGLNVLGIDLSSNMLSIALDRLQRDKDTRVRYSLIDAMKCDYPSETFDLIFSRDGLHHNDNLGLLMKKLYKWLKPGGRMLLTVYGKGRGEFSSKFKRYVEQRQYHLMTLEEMVKITKDAGFLNVEGTDLTPRFKEILLGELKNAKDHKEDFLKRFNEKKYADLINGWNDKLGYIADDNHNWIQIFAVKS